MGNPDTTLITHLSWGHMEVTIDGHTYRFKDCKVWSGRAKEWDWNLTGTHHRPGFNLPTSRCAVLGIRAIIEESALYGRQCMHQPRVLNEKPISERLDDGQEVTPL